MVYSGVVVSQGNMNLSATPGWGATTLAKIALLISYLCKSFLCALIAFVEEAVEETGENAFRGCRKRISIFRSHSLNDGSELTGIVTIKNNPIRSHFTRNFNGLLQ